MKLYTKSNKFSFFDKTENYYGLTDTYIMIPDIDNFSMKVLTGILNSRLMNFYVKNFGKLKRDDYYEYSRNILGQLPIKTPSESNKNNFLIVIDQILTAKKADPNADTGALEQEIDKLVYELYNLTPDEIKIIESS